MKPTLLLGWILCLASSSHAGHWYETLRPGVTRSEILGVAGSPTFSAASMETYKQAQGRIVCNYDGNVLHGAVYYDTPEGAVSCRLYSTEGELKDADLEQRRTYLRRAKFTVLPKLSGRSVYTHKYRGASYEADGRFIVIEPIINLAGGSGYFADKAARVLLAKPDGTEEVLYRAAEHWEALKPPGLPDREVEHRTSKIKEAGVHIIGTSITEVLGQSDSSMGSGIDYRLFYLCDGLLIVACAHLDEKIANALIVPGEKIANALIVKPGLTNLTVSEWLAGAQPTHTVDESQPSRSVTNSTPAAAGSPR